VLSIICLSSRRAKSCAWIVDPRSGKRLLHANEPIHAGEFIGENLPRIAELLLIVDALNGKQLFYAGPREQFADYDRMLRETPSELRELVDAWLASGPNLDKFRQNHPKMWAGVSRYWQITPTQLVSADSTGGGAAIALGSEPGRNPYEEALRFFVWLITNPECDRLAGPCARCGAYYIRIRRSAQNKYCSRSCGTRATAFAATRKRRDEEHADKLLRAAEGAREWTTARTKKEWKPWVSGRHPGITVKFLTRAVNNGELKSPTKGEKP
jgi:hypothetical protein